MAEKSREIKSRKSNGGKSKVHMVSLGCAKNLVDSEIMLGTLAQAGYSITVSPDDADIIVVNTCGFVHDAVEESEEVIREMAVFKTKGKCRKLAVTGCLAERFREELLEKIPEIDILTGVASCTEIAELLKEDKAVSFGKPKEVPGVESPRLLGTLPWTAYLRTAEGCDNRCSYCMIPSIRGPFRSRTVESLETEAKQLAAMGVKELILVAQDNTRFGEDLTPKSSLPELLRRLDRVEGIEWLRVMYCHPARVDDVLLETMAAGAKILPYLDIPMQHAHPDVLRGMNRPDDPAKVLDMIRRARELMPDICIRTTFMVGFPGETEKHFSTLLDFVKEARFDMLGAFKFSAEAGAPAVFLPNQVNEAEKAERFDRLMTIQQHISLENNKKWVNKSIKVLVEGSTTTPHVVVGRSFRHAPDVDGCVFLEGDHQPGTFVNARVRRALQYDLFAVPVKK